MREIPYRVIRSDRKTMGLEIGAELEVLVRAPKRVQEAFIEEFVHKHRAWILEKLEKRRAFLEAHPTPTEAELRLWMVEAKARIPERVAHYAGIMGLTYAGIRFNRNKTRIGSCCRKNLLSFSCRLMGYSQEVVDYVIVHELAHVPHKNHGPAFWRTVEAVLPDYRLRRRMLRG